MAAGLMSVGAMAADRVVYTAYDRAGTLTYYYDDQGDTRAMAGYVTELYDPVNKPKALRFKGYHDEITKVVIDKSMKDKSLRSTANMFYGGYEIQGNYLINYNLSNMTQISGMENLFTVYAEDMTGMFRGCSALTTIDLSGFNVYDVTSMYEMFCDCKSLETLDLSSFDTRNVTNMNRMFKNCSSLKSLDVRPLNTANVKYMEGMFAGCTSLESLDLRLFDTDKLKYPASMFEGCTSLQTIYCYDNWNIISGLEDTSNMFAGCTSLVGDKGTKCDGETHTDKSYARPDLGESQPGYFTKKAGKEVYTLFDANTGTLTYYCDNIYAGRKAMGDIVELYDPVNAFRKARFEGYSTKVKKAVIDESMKDTLLTSTRSMFWGGDHDFRLVSLEEISGMANLNTANVTDMRTMFYGCISLKSLDVSRFNTANVTDMSGMFANCYSLKSIDVSGFNTANVTDMGTMFSRCESLKTLDLRHFNTSKVKNFTNMFYVWESTSLTTILCNDDWSKNPNVEKSTDMFWGCKKLKGRRGTSYDKDHVTIEYARPDGVGGPGYFTNVAETYTVFDEATGTLTYYYDGIRASRNGICEFYTPEEGYDIVRFEGYADKVKKAVIDYSFKAAPLTSLANMFDGGSNATRLSALETIEGLANINFSEVTSLYSMFKGCSSLKSIDMIPFQAAGNVENVDKMFEDCAALTTLDMRTLNTAKVTSMYHLFSGCSSLKTINLYPFNTANVTDMGGMFEACYALTSLDLRSFNTEKVEWMSYMFAVCYSLKSLDLTSFNTANVVSMGNMFSGCSELKSVDLRSFDIANVREMDHMFNGCWDLTTILCTGDWTTGEELLTSNGMFADCSHLEGDNGTKWDADYTDITYARLDEGNSAPGYFSTTNEVYTIFDAETGTLTYYCDDMRMDRSEETELYDPNDVQTVRFKGYNEDVQLIVLDESMKGAVLTSLRNMFFGGGEYDENTLYVRYPLTNAKEIEGLGYLVTDYVRDMNGMFYGCASLQELNFLSFNIANVKDMSHMFEECTNLTTIYCNEDWNASKKLESSDNMFAGCISLVGGNETGCDGENTIDKSYARPDGIEGPGYFTPVKKLYSVFDENSETLTYYYDDELASHPGTYEYYTPQKGHDIVRFKGYADKVKKAVIDPSLHHLSLKSLANMFDGLTSLESVEGLEYINFCAVTDMYAMFRNCSSLKQLDATMFKTARVKNFSSMFYGCSSLKELDVTSFSIGNARDMSAMFANCVKLTTLRCDKDWSKYGMPCADMFYNCTSLVGRKGTQCNGIDQITNMLARPDGSDGNPGYFTQSLETSKKGFFSINEDGGMVQFSPGNLQFNAAKGTHQCADGTTKNGTWRFAPNQWNCIGEGNENISESYNGWIDLFGWATSGWDNGAKEYQPWSAGTEYNDYLKDNIGLADFNEVNIYGDWGLYNQIGDDAPGTWRTLSPTEWKYILNERPFAGNLRGNGVVNGVRGYILLPDDWSTPNCLTFEWSSGGSPGTTDWYANVFDGKDWEAMEEAGAVFLPAAGYRNNLALGGFGQYGYYWANTVYNASGVHYFYLFFMSSDISSSNSYYNYEGRSVRLVKAYEPKPEITSDYNDPQADLLTVTIDANEGSTIYYQVITGEKKYDGAELPGESWQEYDGQPLSFTPNVKNGETKFITVFAYAVNADGVKSLVAAEEYEFSKPKIPDMPVITTNYSSPQDESLLVMMTAEEGATIRYKVLVTDYQPSDNVIMNFINSDSWNRFFGAFYVFPETETGKKKYVTIVAYAESEEGLSSEIAKVEYTYSKPVPPTAPQISSDYEGEGSSSVTVTITADEGTTIWYKVVVSGEEEDEDGEVWKQYTGPISITPDLGYGESQSVTILTYTEKDGVQSDLVIVNYGFSKPEQPEKPVITSDYEGPEAESASVSVSAEKDAAIWYAIIELSYDEDGNLIDIEDYSKAEFKLYEDAVAVVPEGEENSKVAYKFVTYAEKEGVQSDYASETFEFDLPELLDAPAITSDYEGPEAESASVSVSAEEGAAVYYAIIELSYDEDGNLIDTEDYSKAEFKLYEDAVAVVPEGEENSKVAYKFVAYAEKEGVQSEYAAETFEFELPELLDAPAITSDYKDPKAESITVTVTSEEGAKIWYKVIIGDEPYEGEDESDWKEYTEPFIVTPEADFGETKYVTILAYAEKNGVESETATAEYEFSKPEKPGKPIITSDYKDQEDESITVTVSEEGEFDIWYKVIIGDEPYDGKDESEWKEYTEPFTVTPEVGEGETKFVTILSYAVNDGVVSETAKTEYIFSKPEPVVCPEFMFFDSNDEPIVEPIIITLGNPFESPKLKLLSDEIDYAVTYSSDNEEVAVIDENGDVQIIGAGEAVITADVNIEGISKDECPLDYLSYIIVVAEPEELDPLPADKETTLDFSLYDSATDSKLFGITLGAEDEFNEEEGRMEVSSTNTLEEIDAKLEEVFEGESSLSYFLPGTITFELPADEGTIEIDCQTLPGYVLKVRIAEYGEAYITSTVEQAERGKATVNFNVSQKTLVVIYLEGVNKDAGPARIARSEKEEDAGAYVYSIKITPKKNPTGLEDIQPAEDGTRKMLINEHLYILRGGKTYDATGRMVK